MAGKPGFMMYHSKARTLAKMGAESFMAIILAMCDYSEFGAEPTALNDTEAMAFDMMRDMMDYDEKKYQKRVEAGRKGGLAKSSNAKQSLANPSESSDAKQSLANPSKSSDAKQSLANLPNTNPNTNPKPKPNPKPNTNTNLGNYSSSSSYAREEEEFPPTAEMVEEYVREKGLNVDAQEFIDRCEANGWKDGKGRPVINWRTWLAGYALKAIRPEEGGAARMRPGQPDPRIAALEAMKGEST